MVGYIIFYFQNDGGYCVIEVGVKEFMCMGVFVFFDYLYIYIDMGVDSEKVCFYCLIFFKYNLLFKENQINFLGCVFFVKVV